MSETVTTEIKLRLFGLVQAVLQRRGRRAIRRQEPLWTLLSDYLRRTHSTGCSYSDYWELFRTIRRLKPRRVLELGTGVSTVVIGCALLANREEGYDGSCVSMEEDEKWFSAAAALIPDALRPIINLVLSPTEEAAFSLYRGIRYKHVPAGPYDFVFVDGPDYRAKSDGMKTFDFDMVDVILTADQPVSAIIDKRLSTCYILQKVLGPGKVTYNPFNGLGFVHGCTKYDLRDFAEPPSASFAESFRMIRDTELHLQFTGRLIGGNHGAGRANHPGGS